MKKSSKQQRQPRRPRGRDNNSLGSGGKPTLVLDTHLMISQNVTGTNLKQVNITPSLSSFPKAVEQAAFYQQYKVVQISYTILPLDIVNQTTGTNQLDLVYLYDVPLRTNQIPLAT